LPVVRIDAVLIEQVVVNLVTNAIDELKNHDGVRELCIRSRLISDDEVCVEVQDTGPGIKSSSPDDVFKPFFTTKGHGLGMGLAISRSIVQGHGGSLTAESPPEGGALFRLRLPTTVVQGEFHLDPQALGDSLRSTPFDQDVNST
jgi:C4-dicarboxylate-specific signal transduction histidine kinase